MISKKEILERILLNMKYDSKKTLSENKQDDFITEIGADNNPLFLPKNAEIKSRFNCVYRKNKWGNNLELIKKDFPSYNEACKTVLNNKGEQTINDCILNYFNTWENTHCVNNSVHTFSVNNELYRPCQKTKTPTGQWLNPERMIVTGYVYKDPSGSFTKEGDCNGKKWQNTKKDETKPGKEELGTPNLIKGTEGGWGSEFWTDLDL